MVEHGFTSITDEVSFNENDDESSFCGSTIASSTVLSKKCKSTKSTPAKKVAKKKQQKKTPANSAAKTPEANKVTKYLITPIATHPNVPATVSTVASSVSSYGCPPGTVHEYDNRVQSETLPDSFVLTQMTQHGWTIPRNLKLHPEDNCYQPQLYALQVIFVLANAMAVSTCLIIVSNDNIVISVSRL